MVQLNIELSDSEWSALRREAERSQLSEASFARIALQRFLEQQPAVTEHPVPAPEIKRHSVRDIPTLNLGAMLKPDFTHHEIFEEMISDDES